MKAKDNRIVIAKEEYCIKHYADIIKANLQIFIDKMTEIKIEDYVIDYLEKAPNDCKYSGTNFNKTVKYLDKLWSFHQNSYIAFLGITKNKDTIDNFGHSRVLRTIKLKQTQYDLFKRDWHEYITSQPQELVVSMPYVDSSGSYVIAILKKIYKEGKYIGVLGVNFLFDSLIKVNNGDHLIVITNQGKVIYNNYPRLKYILEKQNNIFYMIDYKSISSIFSKKEGRFISDFLDETSEIDFYDIFDNRFYLLKIRTI